MSRNPATIGQLGFSEFLTIGDHLGGFLARYPITLLTDITISRCPAPRLELTSLLRASPHIHTATFEGVSDINEVVTQPNVVRGLPCPFFFVGKARLEVSEGAGYKQRCGDNRHVFRRPLPFNRAQVAKLAGSQCSFVQLCIHQKKDNRWKW